MNSSSSISITSWTDSIPWLCGYKKLIHSCDIADVMIGKQVNKKKNMHVFICAEK